ncbi:MAG: hypothetical protein M3R69_02565 [Acidobacteriota bacterium]|nr:hypothetical protein [Acidobacteriota bacterium]
MAPDSCYLSIVATARNDDHGGNLLGRMQLFVSGLLEQCRRHQLNAELILVEWNPPEDKPRLSEALSWPVDNGPCSVRIIEVSPEIHARFKYSDRLPLFQMLAKNAGVRRARGQFVLATNIDILFSDELIHFLSSGRLRQNRMYRINRYDVKSDVPTSASIEAQLAYCRDNLLRINDRNGTKNLITGHHHAVYDPAGSRSWLQEKISELKGAEVTERTRLHTNGCGDFTLMSRARWFELRGYPEFEMYCMHLDSLLCHAAHHNGAREQVLDDPMRIYHIEHGVNSGDSAGAALASAETNSQRSQSKPEEQKNLDMRGQAGGIPQLDHAQFTTWAIQMRRERRPIIFNDAKWGLADDDLPETIVFAAGKVA